jgi:hypothetical protein
VWYAVTITEGQLDSVWPAAFTRTTLGRANLASAGGMQLEAARLSNKQPGELTTRAEILETLAQLL